MKKVLYKTKKLKVERIINNLKKLGIKNIEEITKRYEKICDDKNTTEIDERIQLLEEMERELKDYNELYKIKNKIRYLSDTIDEVKDAEKLEECKKLVSEIYNYYNNITTDIKDYDLEKIYLIIYKTIKKEILINKNSEILELIKNNEIFCYQISKYIETDVENIMGAINTNPLIKKIKNKIHELNINGAEISLVDYDLIKLIVVFNNYNEHKKEYKKMLEETKTTLELNFEEFEQLYIDNSLNDKIRELDQINNKYKDFNSVIIRKIISIILSLSLYTAVGVVTPSILKPLCNGKIYKTTTQTYIEGKNVEVKESYTTKNSEEKIVTLAIGGKIGHTYYRYRTDTYRELEIYDLTDIVLDTIEEYAKLDLEHYQIKPNPEHGQAYDVTLLEEGEKQVTIITQDFNTYKPYFDEHLYNCILPLVYAIELMCLALPFSPINRLRDLLKYAKNCSIDKKTYEKVLNIVLELVKKLENIIEENTKASKNYRESSYIIEGLEFDKEIRKIEALLKEDTKLEDQVKELRLKYKKHV